MGAPEGWFDAEWLRELVESAAGDARLLGRLVIAAVLASAIGYDRERRERDAGLRTHMLVGLTAALLVGVGAPLVTHYRDALGDEVLRFDPARLIGAMVTGVSFLGAGMIFVSHGDRVQGLTTAASILATATVGMAVGVGRYVLATGTTVVILIILAVLRRLRIAHKDE